MKSARLIKTDSYFNIFDVLKNELNKKPNTIDDKRIIFCEEKISLRAESVLCGEKSGSFSTFVFSFSKYLKKSLSLDKVLTKEGSSMAIKRLLKDLPLKCFNRSKHSLSSSIYNLIVQLKSAQVSTFDIENAIKNTNGVLKNKLEDILLIYSAYEDFIKSNGYDDQSSLLTYLPEIIKNDSDIKNTDIILLGYTSWTRQALNIVKALLENAKSLTIILTGGENKFVYLNEVENLFIKTCEELKISVESSFEPSNFNIESEKIVKNIFSPKTYNESIKKTITDKISVISAISTLDEIEKTAEIIKYNVIVNNARYRDFTVAIGENENLKYSVKKVFDKLEIPYYFDQKIKGEYTALVRFILDYIEACRKNFERGAVCSFFKNPLFNLSKEFADSLENYIISYNINYMRFKKPFTLAVKGENLDEFNAVREQLVEYIEHFDIRKMLEKLNVKERQEQLTLKFNECGCYNEQAVNSQIYSYVIKILDEIDLLLGKNVSIADIKETFISGIKALELSIIPQYKDAVFIGGYKESAIIQNKTVFALELTSDVPFVKEDVAILSDSDLVKLDNIKVIIEPKIKIVNHREREAVAMALSCFTNNLYICCPNVGSAGKKNSKSEIFSYLDKLFTLSIYDDKKGYLTQKQGLDNFSKECTRFADGRSVDFQDASNFYYAVKPNIIVDRILEKANKQIEKIVYINRPIIQGVTSPTKIENYSHCPYKAFIDNYLRASNRENGLVNALSVGNIIHEVFEAYVKKIDLVSDRTSSDDLTESLLKEILATEEFSKFLTDERESATIKRIKAEAKEFCYRIYLTYADSKFLPLYVEKKFGSSDKESLPPVKLLGGKIKLKGKIDRVDKYNNYLRVIDYKTGKVDSSKGKKELFVGNKLQLFLYRKALEQDLNGSDSKLAGVYYMPINNKFESKDDKDSAVVFQGDSLKDEELLLAQDKNFSSSEKSKITGVNLGNGRSYQGVDEETLSAFTSYAVAESESLAGYMYDGLITPSPINDACKYCSYHGLCDRLKCEERELKSVSAKDIASCVKNKEKE